MRKVLLTSVLVTLLSSTAPSNAQETFSWSEAPGPATEVVEMAVTCEGKTVVLRIQNQNLRPSTLVELSVDGRPLAREAASVAQLETLLRDWRKVYLVGSRCSDVGQTTFWVQGLEVQPEAGSDGTFLRPVVIRY